MVLCQSTVGKQFEVFKFLLCYWLKCKYSNFGCSVTCRLIFEINNKLIFRQL